MINNMINKTKIPTKDQYITWLSQEEKPIIDDFYPWEIIFKKGQIKNVNLQMARYIL